VLPSSRRYVACKNSAPGHSMSRRININKRERWASAIGGAALAVAGIKRMIEANRGAGSFLLATGTGLIWRSATGHCHVYEAADIDTSSAARSSTKRRLAGPRGVNVKEAVTINGSPEELYETWSNFEQLPRVMPELVSVKRLDK